jgi:hypothetical protein
MPSEKVPATTLAEAVARYHKRGGNRTVDPKALEHLGGIDVATINRNWLLEKARQLYPKLTIAERMEHFIEPLAEILDLPPAELKTAAWYAERKLERDAAYHPELVRVYEWLKPPSYPLAEALIEANTERYLARQLTGAAPGDVSADNFAPLCRGPDDWASITPPKVPGPPPDPGPREENYYVGGTASECWHWRHRGQVSLLRMDDGTQIHFGYAESRRQPFVYGSVRYDYLGYLHGKPGRPRKPKPPKPPAKIGRPRKPEKESAADKQRRYRERRKQSKES